MKFLNKKLFGITLAFILVMTPVFFVFADVSTCESGKICNPIQSTTINGFIKTLLVGILKIAMPIIALAIIYSGFLFVAARGNPEKITAAKDALLYTLIGAAVLLGAWAIAQLISETVLAL